ncbi:MAG: peptidase M4 family protein [Methanothrix sp.]|nr:MAG: peptidase M4 family protein [Methanothrix sp.]
MYHHYTYIPSYILKNIAKSDHEDAKKIAQDTLKQGTVVRAERKDLSNKLDIATITGSRSTEIGQPSFATFGITKIAEKSGSRVVYDCEHKWELTNRKEVRGEGDPETPNDAVNAAYEFAGSVRDLFQSIMGRKSIDNLGMNLVLNIHYGEKYMNAFWDGSQMIFGDGDGEIFSNFTKSPDVIAHELAHGITQFTANLKYEGQSGALNEHFSDVFGTFIVQKIKSQTAETADWLIGDEIMGPELFGEALRSMREPGTAYDNQYMGKDTQPGHMDQYYSGPEDNQGVHTNSGIPNKAFYLTAMDIGTENAAKIWYHGLQNLFPNATFNDAYNVITTSARILTKFKKVPDGSTQVVRKAFKEVGLPRNK